MGIVMALVMARAPEVSPKEFPASPAFFKMILFMGVLMYVLPAIWGICTSIGLFRLRNWARLSIIVFSVLLILMFGFGGLIAFLLPFPSAPGQPVDASVVTGVRIFMGVLAAALVTLGIWWIVFFTRPGVVSQFVPTPPVPDAEQAQPFAVGVPQRASNRPLSITILAWFLLVGCMLIPVSILLHSPAVLFTKLLTGGPAVAYFLVFAAVALYVGIGLLRLQPNARIAGIAYFGFAFVNAAVFYLAPGARVRVASLLAVSQSMFPAMPASSQVNLPFDTTSFLVICGAIGLVVVLVPMYILISQKQAFSKAEIERQTAL
jgi:hypothetical protein